MKPYQTLLVTALIVFISCSDNNDTVTHCGVNKPLEELSWLKEIKNAFEQSLSPSRKEIYQYNYNEETIFLIDDCVGCADALQVVYNCSGVKICEFGGISGLNTCPDFFDTATDKKLLWPYENTVIIDKGRYQSVRTDNYTIQNITLNNDILTATITSGGCDGNSWIVNLVDSGAVAESEPPQRFLKIELQNNEVCLALITKEVSFNVSCLKAGSSAIILNIEDWQNKILYN